MWASPCMHIILKTITTTGRLHIEYKHTTTATPSHTHRGGGGGNISLWDNPSIHMILLTMTITGEGGGCWTVPYIENLWIEGPKSTLKSVGWKAPLFFDKRWTAGSNFIFRIYGLKSPILMFKILGWWAHLYHKYLWTERSSSI